LKQLLKYETYYDRRNCNWNGKGEYKKHNKTSISNGTYESLLILIIQVEPIIIHYRYEAKKPLEGKFDGLTFFTIQKVNSFGYYTSGKKNTCTVCSTGTGIGITTSYPTKKQAKICTLLFENWAMPVA
jgi:hypothetical protein